MFDAAMDGDGDDLLASLHAVRGCADQLGDAAVQHALAHLAQVERAAAAARLALVRAYVRNEVWRLSGVSSAATGLQELFGVDERVARGWLRTAERLGHCPQTASALASGQISEAQAAAVASGSAMFPLAADPTAVEAEFITTCALVAPTEMRRIVRDRRDALMPMRNHRWPHRHLALVPAVDGGMIHGELTGEAFELVHNAIEALVAGERGQRDEGDDRRTMAQRRHDALAEMARRFLGAPDAPMVRGARPVVNVAVVAKHHHSGLGAHFDSGVRLHADTYRRLTCDCAFVRITTDAKGMPLDVGRRSRLVPDPLWRALVVRDRGCRVCGRAVVHCEAHHVVHWADGGATALDNLVVLCRRCHHHVHEDGWSLRLDADGALHVTRPGGRATEVLALPPPWSPVQRE